MWGANTTVEQALRRLWDLDPQKAADFLRDDIASGKLRFAGYAVREFPAQELPAADPVFSKLLDQNLHGVLPLVAKFGSVNLVEKMRTINANSAEDRSGGLRDCAA